MNPLAGVAVASITAIFDESPELTLISPEYRHQAAASLLGDFIALEKGDYLVGQQTWFVSHIEPLRPASCILCNRVLSISAPAVATSTGVNAYGGTTAASNVPLASGWPASVLTKTHIEIDPTRLPSDTKTSFFEVLLPPIPGIVLKFGLILTDEIGQQYMISAAEDAIGGWRLLAGIQTT